VAKATPHANNTIIRFIIRQTFIHASLFRLPRFAKECWPIAQEQDKKWQQRTSGPKFDRLRLAHDNEIESHEEGVHVD